jgi:hypothetical protein
MEEINLTDDLISFNLSKLIKEKNIDIKCNKSYSRFGDIIFNEYQTSNLFKTEIEKNYFIQ